MFFATVDFNGVTPLVASIGSVVLLSCVLFVLYRWRVAYASGERKRLYYVASAIIIVIGALIPYSR
jgi:hypothetical protein